MAHKNHAIFASLNYMHCSTLSMMFTQEGLLKTAVPKHLSHYTFKCVRIHMRLPIIVTMTNKSSATSGNDVQSSLRLRELRELLEAQGAMRASIPYRDVIVSASAR